MDDERSIRLINERKDNIQYVSKKKVYVAQSRNHGDIDNITRDFIGDSQVCTSNNMP
jgi:hypothetical protein